MMHLITHCQAAELIERAHIAVRYTLTERETETESETPFTKMCTYGLIRAKGS